MAEVAIAKPRFADINLREDVSILRTKFHAAYHDHDLEVVQFRNQNESTRGWKVHVRIERERVEDFVDQFIPFLKRYENSGVLMKVMAYDHSKYANNPEYLKQTDPNYKSGMSQQVGKFITLYVGDEQRNVIPLLTLAADQVIEKIHARTTFEQLTGMGMEARPIIKEPIMGKNRAVSIRWSSDFYGKDRNLDFTERQSEAYNIIKADPEKLAHYKEIQDSEKEISRNGLRNTRLLNRMDIVSQETKGNLVVVKDANGYDLAKIEYVDTDYHKVGVKMLEGKDRGKSKELALVAISRTPYERLQESKAS